MTISVICVRHPPRLSSNPIAALRCAPSVGCAWTQTIPETFANTRNALFAYWVMERVRLMLYSIVSQMGVRGGAAGGTRKCPPKIKIEV